MQGCAGSSPVTRTIGQHPLDMGADFLCFITLRQDLNLPFAARRLQLLPLRWQSEATPSGPVIRTKYDTIIDTICVDSGIVILL